MKKPYPTITVAFALTVVGRTLRGALYEENGSKLEGEHLVTELARMLKGYLGVK